MTRSSEVVMRLNGLDATDGMFDLVFSRPQGETFHYARSRRIDTCDGVRAAVSKCSSRIQYESDE